MNHRQKVRWPAAAALVVGTMIGTGVYSSLGYQLEATPSAFPVLLLWILGGILSAFGAVNYAELTAALPRSGGEYHLLGRVYHPSVGFLSGWISITVGFPAPIAVSAVLFSHYAASALGLDPEKSTQALPLLTVGLIAGMTLLHGISIRTSGSAQTALTVVKVVLLTALAVSGFAVPNPQEIPLGPKPGDAALMGRPDYAMGLIFVLYAYSGWNAACYIAGEMEHPGRDIPKALLTGTAVVAMLYVALNAAFLYSTPLEKLRGEPDAAFPAAQAIFGESGARLAAGLIAAGLVSTISGLLWAGTRVAQTMGQDHPLLAPLGQTNRHGVPWAATLFQGGFALLLFGLADVPQMLSAMEFSLQLVLLLTVWGVVHLRRKEPDLARPYRTWGYPWTTGIFVAAMIFILAYILQNRHRESLWGLGNALLAFILYSAAATWRARPGRRPR